MILPFNRAGRGRNRQKAEKATAYPVRLAVALQSLAAVPTASFYHFPRRVSGHPAGFAVQVTVGKRTKSANARSRPAIASIPFAIGNPLAIMTGSTGLWYQLRASKAGDVPGVIAGSSPVFTACRLRCSGACRPVSCLLDWWLNKSPRNQETVCPKPATDYDPSNSQALCSFLVFRGRGRRTYPRLPRRGWLGHSWE